MSPKYKIVLGALLVAPTVIGSLWATVYRFDNPVLTDTQVFNDTFPWMAPLFLVGIVGIALIDSGFEENADE